MDARDDNNELNTKNKSINRNYCLPEVFLVGIHNLVYFDQQVRAANEICFNTS